MPDRVQTVKIPCEGGLDRNNNSFYLSAFNPGAATSLINYESAISGGYRRISGFEKFDDTYSEVTSVTDPAEGRVLGIWAFWNSGTQEYQYIAARKQTSGATYKFYLFNPLSGWSAFATGYTHTYSTSIKRIRAEQFDFGDGNKIIFVDGVNKAHIYDGTNWYDINSASSGANAANAGGAQAIDDPIVCAVFKNHLFIAKEAIIAHSAPNAPYDWTAASGGGQLVFPQDVVNIKPFRDQLFAWGNNKIRLLEGFVDQTSGDVSGFLQNGVTDRLGCISRDSLIEVGGNLLFVAPDGIRPIAATDKINDIELNLLSESIQPIINENFPTYDRGELVAVGIANKTQFRYFLSAEDDEVAQAYGIIGCYRLNGLQGPKWEFMELYGIRASCAWSGVVDNEEVILHGDYNGHVYRQEVGNNFDGANIAAVYTTPYLDFGDSEVRKTMKSVNLFVNAEGSMSFNMGVAYDWGDVNVINPPDYTNLSLGRSPRYDDGLTQYDDGSVYGGGLRYKVPINIQGSGYSVRFSLVTNGTDPSHTIQAMVPEFTVRGRQ